MRNNIIITYTCVLIYLIFGCKSHSDIPFFRLQFSDSTTTLSSIEIPFGRPIIIMFFSSDCEHCQLETEEIIKNIAGLKNVRIYLVTEDPLDRMIVFNKHYGLVKYPNIEVGRDYNFDFIKHFEVTTTPFIILYSKTKRLIKIIKGPAPVSRIIEVINEM